MKTYVYSIAEMRCWKLPNIKTLNAYLVVPLAYSWFMLSGEFSIVTVELEKHQSLLGYGKQPLCHMSEKTPYSPLIRSGQ